MPNRGAVPIVRLMETNLPQKSGTWQAVNVLTPEEVSLCPVNTAQQVRDLRCVAKALGGPTVTFAWFRSISSLGKGLR